MRLAGVEPDDRTILCGECETFRLAIQIPEPPRIEERGCVSAYTSEFRYCGPPLASLQGLDETEQVIYVGTLNKALFPGLRIGSVVPRPLLQAFIGARYLIDRQPATLQQDRRVYAAGSLRCAHPSHAADVSRAARRPGGHFDATRVKSTSGRCARSGHASACLSVRRHV